MRILPAMLSPGRVGIVAGCGLLIAAGWALTVERIAFEREEGARHALQQNANLAIALEEHTRRTLQGVDRMVRFIRHEYVEARGRPDLRYLLAEADLDSKAITTAAVIDARGKVVFSIKGNEGGNVADREYFAFHQAMPGDELRIGPSVTGRFTKRTTIHLTRPMYDTRGRFDGVVLVGVDPQYFAQLYSEVDLRERGVVLLAGLDGRVRARRAGDSLSFGQDLAGTRLFRELGKAPVGGFVGNRGPDGVPRYVSYRQLRDYPLVVAVGTAHEDVLAEFHERRGHYLTSASLATLLVAMFGALLLAARRHQQAEMAAKLESEARFRSLTELSSDFYWESDAEHRLVSRGSGGKPSPVGAFEKGTVLGKRRWEIPYLAPDEAGWRAHRETLEQRLAFRNFELARRRDDGSEHFVSISGDPVFDAAGGFTGYRGVGTDITARKRAERELRESERRFRDMLGKVQLVSLMLDRDARITYCNDYLLELTGWKREEVIGRGWFALFIPDDASGLHQLFARLLDNDPGAWHHENEICTRSGERRLVRWNNTVLRSISGEVIGTASIGEDITEQRSAERARLALAQRAAAQAYALGAVSSSDALAAGEVEQVACLVTELAAGATGVARANVWLFDEAETELRCIDLFEADARRHSAGARLTESQFTNEFRALKSARYVNADDPLTDPRTAGYVESYLKPLGITSMLDVVVQVSGKHLGLLCLEHVGAAHHWSEDEIGFACQLADKIALAITNRERRVAEARYRATFEQSATGIVHTSLEGMILSANRKFCRMLGYDERELVGRGVDEVTHAEDRTTTLAAARELALHTEDSFVPEYEKRYVRKDGSALWVALSVCVVRDARGLPQYFIGLATDITTRKQAEEQLLRRAHYDALTDLPNRVLCFDRLSQAIAQAGRKQWNAGVLFLDLDRFKVVNDTLGHASGDAVLRLAAERLQGCVRAGDTVARVGGDEFVVVLAELASPQDGAIVAQKLIDAMARPVRFDGKEIFITPSIGIATFPADGRDGEALVKNADAAMLRAKQVGRNNYQFYTAAMNERALEKLQLETDLRRALERNEFFLHYQPKVSLASGQVTGVEALLRWNRPGHGPVSPAQFVPILEDCGLIVPVGDWIIDAACAQVRAWRDAGLAPVQVAVNLAAKQFLHHDIGAVIDAALARHGIPGSLLQIEITESDAMASPGQVSAVLRGLKERGVAVAIDDFGTGYSSLGYLKRFPLDTLKLDRSFVTGLPGDGDDVSIALAVIGMAHSLGLKVVAEGVEKAEQRDFLSAHGCDEMQGYLFSRPVAAEACASLLRDSSAAFAA